ncbi:hypothetical protein G8E10_11270 [Rhizobiaceae bacterium CRRU44]|uniref:J domain-containing protein n=1 Tax=Ferranicluibacter rubi TaxID=2715133 RepID=A0AA43ZEE4_9HYPH|nr:hypothetical protein [Ferranicluibacter rubi]NHT76318.1 hypothetical protein [Ferranicluibacter rubi]
MFGKSLFQSVLERIEAEDPREDAEATPRSGIAGFNAGLAFDTERAAGGDAVRQAYADMDEAVSAAPEPPLPRPAPVLQAAKPLPRQRPAHLDRLTPAQVAEDLELSNADTPVTLAERRRAFANRNHPDRHAPEDREAATTRMTIANMLVDEALRRLKRGLPIGMTPQRPR